MQSDHPDYLAQMAEALSPPSQSGHRARAVTLIRAALKELNGRDDFEDARHALLQAKHILGPDDSMPIRHQTLH